MPALTSVTFEPLGVSVDVPPGITILEAARRADVGIAATCGGKGTCGTCAVRVLDGAPRPPSPLETQGLRAAPPSVRLACLAQVEGPIVVRPLATAVPAAATMNTTQAAEAGRPVSFGSESSARAVGVDLGTSTVAAAFASLTGGALVPEAVRSNPQSSFGADVASRIAAAMEGEAERLARLARSVVSDVVSDACDESDACLDNLERVVVAANQPMAHLLVGADVTGLAEHPYRAAWTGPYRASAAELQLGSLPADADIYVMPAFGAFAGGDLVAGVLSIGLDQERSPAALVDLGTNAEVAVFSDGEMVVTSAPAGPAFEAVGMTCGGPAAPGAIERVEVGSDGGLRLGVIGDGVPSWLCGSGLLETVRVLLESGHLDATGRLIPEGPLSDRIAARGDITGVVIARGGDSGPEVLLSQLDIREVQLAKAALRVALDSAMKAAGIGWDSLSRLYVAGSFGESLRSSTLGALGVVPAEAEDRIRYVGRAALSGAAAVAADPSLERRAEDLVGQALVLDLPAERTFRERFVKATSLP